MSLESFDIKFKSLVGGIKVTVEGLDHAFSRKTWIQVGRSYEVKPLRGTTHDGRKGILESFDETDKSGELRFTDTQRAVTVPVWLSDLVEIGSDPIAASTLSRAKVRSLSASRNVARSAERVEDREIENVTFAAKTLKRKKTWKRPLCEVCRRWDANRGFRVCYQCWVANGKPTRQKTLDLLRDVWRERRANEEIERRKQA